MREGGEGRERKTHWFFLKDDSGVSMHDTITYLLSTTTLLRQPHLG